MSIGFAGEIDEAFRHMREAVVFLWTSILDVRFQFILFNWDSKQMFQKKKSFKLLIRLKTWEDVNFDLFVLFSQYIWQFFFPDKRKSFNGSSML